MAEEGSRYALRGGKWGYERLLLLARERWPDTASLLRRAGLGPGMRCVDVGCGGGAVSLEIARIVGPQGSVVGLDMDATKLALAQEAADRQGVPNVTFRTSLVEEWNEPGAYDIAYSRFLLQHLPDPGGLVRRMWASIREGGGVILEDVDWTGWSSDPPNPGVDFLRDRYIRLLGQRGCDPRIGLRLSRLCREAGGSDPQVSVVLSLHTGRDAMRLAPLTLDGISESLVTEKIASAQEVADARSSLDALLATPGALITGPKIFQVCTRKTHPSG